MVRILAWVFDHILVYPLLAALAFIHQLDRMAVWLDEKEYPG